MVWLDCSAPGLGTKESKILTEGMTLIHYSTLKKSVTFWMLVSISLYCKNSSTVMFISANHQITLTGNGDATCYY